jgi:hypothetical protein
MILKGQQVGERHLAHWQSGELAFVFPRKHSVEKELQPIREFANRAAQPGELAPRTVTHPEMALNQAVFSGLPCAHRRCSRGRENAIHASRGRGKNLYPRRTVAQNEYLGVRAATGKRKETSLDLQPKANHKLDEDDERAGNKLVTLTAGEQTFAGVLPSRKRTGKAARPSSRVRGLPPWPTRL